MVQEGVSVVGFEVPRSPDSSYSNPIPGNEDEAREPPLVPPHLHHTLLNYSHSRDDPGSLMAPQNVILNHLYMENQDGPRSVVALGITHRFRSKYVTVVLYKPVQRRWNHLASPCQRSPFIWAPTQAHITADRIMWARVLVSGTHEYLLLPPGAEVLPPSLTRWWERRSRVI
ncbi:unnamed protein product [Musa textilis]